MLLETAQLWSCSWLHWKSSGSSVTKNNVCYKCWQELFFSIRLIKFPSQFWDILKSWMSTEFHHVLFWDVLGGLRIFGFWSVYRIWGWTTWSCWYGTNFDPQKCQFHRVCFLCNTVSFSNTDTPSHSWNQSRWSLLLSCTARLNMTLYVGCLDLWSYVTSLVVCSSMALLQSAINISTCLI